MGHITDLQSKMPWTDIWSEEFLKDPRPYTKFEHCIINIAAKTGAILQRIEMADHYGQDYSLAIDESLDTEALAIIIMSALKAANVHPSKILDIETAINKDLSRRK